MIRTLLVALFAAAGISSAYAQSTYPNKPIRWIIPYASGGGTDVVARPIALKLGEVLGVPIVYENRGGGGGLIAGETVARSAPDGYTLLVGSGNTHTFPYAAKRQGAVRPGQGLRADYQFRDRSQYPGRPPVLSAEDDPGAGCVRQGESRQDQLGIFGQRLRRPSGTGAVRPGGRHQGAARAIQGCRSRRDRHARRRNRSAVCEHRRVPGAHPVGQAATRGRGRR